jgi:hypothetical protein
MPLSDWDSSRSEGAMQFIRFIVGILMIILLGYIVLVFLSTPGIR